MSLRRQSSTTQPEKRQRKPSEKQRQLGEFQLMQQQLQYPGYTQGRSTDEVQEKLQARKVSKRAAEVPGASESRPKKARQLGSSATQTVISFSHLLCAFGLKMDM